MIGKTISHYKILGKLGEGGMGVVYKAEDIKLKRMVALKLLPAHISKSSEEKARFLHEAQAAAALDHPNICTIYEIEEVNAQIFIAMAYVDGQSLKQKLESGPLRLEEALEIAIQIAEGLKEAYDKGIVHRDIKSANIMVTDKGQAKIMDFGVAKITGGMQDAKAGTTMGTVAYMSPEQASGEEVNHRTDIWSLGVVLYQMITGQLPFQGAYEQAIVYSILNEEPVPIKHLPAEVSSRLNKILRKALAKNLNSRYQNAAEILGNLRKLKKELESIRERSSERKPQPSIAVLPFTNLSADPDQEYFCDGMAEEIINALTHVESLRVVARTSSFAFKGKSEDIREIGRKLNVKALLEGSIQKVGNQVRISAQLVNVADGYHVWSEKYDRNIGELYCPEDNKLEGVITGWTKRVLNLTDKHSISIFFSATTSSMLEYCCRQQSSKNIFLTKNHQCSKLLDDTLLAVSHLEDTLAKVYFRLEEYREAVKAQRKALELDPNSSSFQERLGKMEAALSQ